MIASDQSFLRTLSPLLRGLERHFRAWLDGRRIFPVTLVQRAEMEGLAGDVARQAAALDVEKPALVILLMGGTGVGKSTLLNALAGSSIAEAGFTRPTTRDPVVYHHHALPPEKLDPALRACRLVSHDREMLAQKILVDTPDLDSNDLANRDKLQALLPAADIVLYVGSQEKYHDKLGWELFKSQRQRRAFAFVLNKWDRCSEASASGVRPDADLIRDLQGEGFDHPRLFRTTAQAWIDSTNGEPQVPPGEQFKELAHWLERGLARREIEAVKARGVRQLLAQAQSSVESVKPPELSEEAARVQSAWPPILATEARVSAEVLVGALDPAGPEIEQHFGARGQQRFRGLMAFWMRLTSMRWGVRNLLRTPLPTLPRFGADDRGMDFTALAADCTTPACERVLRPRAQSLVNKLLVEADQKGLPIALLGDRLASVQAIDWPKQYAAAVAETMLDVERDCIQPAGAKAILRSTVTFLANYLPDMLLLGSLGLVLWQFVALQAVPSLAMMLMPLYVTLGSLILLQLLMALLFPVRWSVLRDDFRQRLEAKLTAEYERVYLAVPATVAEDVAKEREAVTALAKEVREVATWLADQETKAQIDDLYGK